MSGSSSSDPGTLEIGEMRERKGHIWLYLANSLKYTYIHTYQFSQNSTVENMRCISLNYITTIV